jgi:NAD(P)-dependent dehydrogenase (short-subunit alcohol dehydrogenase family)
VDLGLEAKVALVTGASQGIGLACATSMMAEGAHVAGTSRGAAPAIEGLMHLQLDMLEPDAGERAVAATVERFGGLDILVNNVGGATIRTGFEDQPDEEWAEGLALNLTTAVRATRAAFRISSSDAASSSTSRA